MIHTRTRRARFLVPSYRVYAEERNSRSSKVIVTVAVSVNRAETEGRKAALCFSASLLGHVQRQSSYDATPLPPPSLVEVFNHACAMSASRQTTVDWQYPYPNPPLSSVLFTYLVASLHRIGVASMVGWRPTTCHLRFASGGCGVEGWGASFLFPCALCFASVQSGCVGCCGG